MKKIWKKGTRTKQWNDWTADRDKDKHMSDWLASDVYNEMYKRFICNNTKDMENKRGRERLERVGL